MPRTVPEWIGRTEDTPVPPRVRLRVLNRFHFRCDADNGGCGRPIRPGVAWICDHITAIVNGGANRERNLHPLCSWCDPVKTAADVAEKSRTYHRKLHHAGIQAKPAGRPLFGTVASGWHKRMNGSIERRKPSNHD